MRAGGGTRPAGRQQVVEPRGVRQDTHGAVEGDLGVPSEHAEATAGTDDQTAEVVVSPTLGDGPQLAISNSFGFGGHNAVVAVRSYEG